MRIRVDSFRILTSRNWKDVVRIVKGRSYQDPLTRGPRVYALPYGSQNGAELKFLEKFVALRNAYSQFLFTTNTASSGWKDGHMEVLLAEDVVPAEVCGFSSHSMRMLALTERI